MPDSRPFRVLGVQQIAVGGLDKGRLRRLWIDTLGLTKTGEFRSERENVDEDIAVAGTGPLKVEVDLMQPLDPAKSPRVHDPALNHVGLWIDDLPAAVGWLEKAGVRFTPGGIRTSILPTETSTSAAWGRCCPWASRPWARSPLRMKSLRRA